MSSLNERYGAFKRQQIEKGGAAGSAFRLNPAPAESQKEERVVVQAGQPYETTTDAGEPAIATPQITLSAADMQQRNYAAYQALTKEKQAEALRTGQQQSISRNEIEGKRTASIAAEIAEKGGVYDYIDIQKARQEAQAENYLAFQQQNLKAQREALQYGMADFGVGTPVSGHPGVFEEVGPGGNIGFTIVRLEPVSSARQVLIERAQRRAREREIARIHDEARAQGYGGSQLSIDEGGNWTFHFVKSASAGKQSSGTAASKPGILYYDPLNPWDVSDRPPEEKQIAIQVMGSRKASNDVPDDPISGFGNYFANIPKGFQGIAEQAQGRKPNVTLAPEIEADTIGAFVQAGQDAIAGRPSTLSKDLGEIGAFIQEKPLFSAGSLAGTVAFTILTFGAGPVLTSARAAVASARTARGAALIGKTAAETVGLESTGVRAAKVSKTGDMLAMKKAPLGIYLETKSVKAPAVTPFYTDNIKIPGVNISFGIKRLNLKGKQSYQAPGKPDLFVIESGLGQDIGYIGVKTGKTAIISPEASLAQKGALLGEKILPGKSLRKVGEGVDIAGPIAEHTKPTPGAAARAESTIDIYQSEARVLQNVQPPSIVGQPAPDLGFKLVRSAKDSVKAAESRPLGATITIFDNKDLLSAGKGAARREQQAAAARDALAEMPGASIKKTPLVFDRTKRAPLEKTSKAPLESISIFASDREVAAAAKKVVLGELMPTAALAKKSKGAAARPFAIIGGSASSKGSLGFGGATGKERKDARDAAETYTALDDDVLSTRTPPGFEIVSRSKSATASDVRPATAGAFKLLESSKSRTAEASAAARRGAIVDLLSKTGTRPTEKLNLAPATGQKSRGALRLDLASQTSSLIGHGALNLVRTEPRARQASRTAARTRQATVQRYKTPLGPGLLRLPSLLNKKTKKKRKGAEGGVGVIGIGVKNALAPAFSIAPEGEKKWKDKRGSGKRRKGRKFLNI